MSFIKVLGIIAEYNPFHNGHKFHISQAKKLTGADFVIAVISGTFTESGNISVIDKFKKAEIAISNGVDLVLELPEVYAICSANYFAYGAIKLLNSLGIVDVICFGSECGKIDILSNIASKLITNEEKMWNNISNQEKNISFAKSRENSLKSILSENELEILKNSNDILAIEYIKELKKLNSNIEFFPLKRDNSSFISATQIREKLSNNDLNSIKNYIPCDTYNALSNKYVLNDSIFELLKYKIIAMDTYDICNIKDISEGLENKIKKEIVDSTTYEELISKIKSKRYQMSKIKRILANILLDISKDDFNHAIKNDIIYIHILKMNENGKKLISKISKTCSFPIIGSINKNKINSLSSEISKYILKDIYAQNIYSILNKEPINKDYTNKL